MRSIKEITDAVIDFAIDGMYSEIEEYDEEDGHYVDINLSPKPELYEKLIDYFENMYIEILKESMSEKEEVKKC